MPPKQSGNKDKDLGEEEEVLQAVVLADSFNKRFRPLTVGKPRCLLPVCNATLLDWTFESLALAGVQEIFVICRSYADQVKAAIRDSKWSKPSTGLKIVPIVTARETFSPGDAMRDIYTHGIITSDFVLVTGDLVSNVHIDAVVRAHKERRRTNKDAIMTMVVMQAGARHRSKSAVDAGVFVLDAETQECLHYEPVNGYPPKAVANIPREILAEHPEIEIRNDFIDCHIDVCSVEVPSLFQDNFDYADIRRDFVYGVLTSDLLMKNIYCYVAKEGYAARVADTKSYDSISKDILSRWTFPLVPDDNHPGGHSYEHLRGNRYIAKDNTVSLSRTCKVGTNTLIGSHTTVADGAVINASVIGRRCKIGENVVLRNAYIGDDSQIGAGSSVEESIIGARVTVGESSKVPSGCLIGDGVVMGKGAQLQRFERLHRRREKKVQRAVDDDDGDADDESGQDSELEDVEENQDPDVSSIVGEGSNAVLWPRGPPADAEDDDETAESYQTHRLTRLGDRASDLALSDGGSETSSSDGESSVSSMGFNALSRTSSATSAAPANLHDLRAEAAASEFRSEVAQSLARAFAEGHSVDNAAVELKTLRMASNVPLRRVREEVVGAIVERIELVEGDPAAQRAAIARVVGRWGALIDRIGGVDPVETVEVLQGHCAQSARLPLFGQILAALYQADIVEEDDIRAWHAKPEARGEGAKSAVLKEALLKCWAVGKMMIEQFDEQESEDEESEEEAPKKAGAKAESDEEDEDEEEEDEEEDNDEAAKPAQAAPKAQEESGEETSEEDSDDAKPPAPSARPAAPAAPTQSSASTAANDEDDEDEDHDDEDDSEETSGSEDGSEDESCADEKAPLAQAQLNPSPTAKVSATPGSPSTARP